MKKLYIAVLLTVASQALYAVEIRVSQFYSDKPMKVTLIYKDNKKHTSVIAPSKVESKTKVRRKNLFAVATKANPVKEIIYSYIGDNQMWFARIHYTKNTDDVMIQITYPNSVYIDSYNTEGGLDIHLGQESITAQAVIEEV